MFQLIAKLFRGRSARRRDPEPMDAATKVKRAAEILKAHRVDKSLSFLIANYHRPTLESLTWENVDHLRHLPLGQQPVMFTFEGKRFKLAPTNRRVSHDGQDHYSDVAVMVAGEIVLETILSEWSENFGGRRFRVSLDSLKSCRLGPWMDDLRSVHELVEASLQKLIAENERDKLRKKADDIDLGGY